MSLTFSDAIAAATRFSGKEPKRVGKESLTFCPAHENPSTSTPSLNIAEGENGLAIIRDRSRGCSYADILRAWGIAPLNGDMFDNRPVRQRFIYRNADGSLFIANKVRFDDEQKPKCKFNRRLLGKTPPLYRLPELLAAPADATVYVTEGEKDTDTLRGMGLVAVSPPFGAVEGDGKWADVHSETLRGRAVVLLQDADVAGQHHVANVAAKLAGIALSVRIVPPFPGPVGTDVSDFAAGHTKDEVIAHLALTAEAAPAIQPTETPEEPDETPVESDGPVQLAGTAITARRPIDEILYHVASVRSAFDRDTLVARMASEMMLRPVAVREELRRIRASRARQRLRVLNPEDAPPEDAPEIIVTPGELHLQVQAAERALVAATSGPAIYQQGGRLVRVIRQSSATSGGVHRAEGALLIAQCNVPYLNRRLAAAARWRKLGRTGDLIDTDPPDKIAEMLLASQGEWSFNPLIGILEAPTLRADGSILDTPGYDEATGLLFEPGSTTFEPVPDKPSLEDARKAADLILQLLVAFPFVAPSDKAVAVAAMLTGVSRRAYAHAPMFGFSAPKFRSGKSTLADLVALLATGRPCAGISQAKDPDEEKKRLLAVLLSGDPVICWDNITHTFGGAAISQVLTQDTIQDRILGVSQMATASTAVTMLATGNNLTISDDLTSRVVLCTIDPELERPEEREFDPAGKPLVNLYEYVPAHRHTLVPALLTILRAFHLAGRPTQNLPRWGGFEGWSGLVRDAVVWIGLQDPCEGRKRVEELDPSRERLRTALTAWKNLVGTSPSTVSEVIRAACVDGHQAEREMLVEAAGKRDDISAQALGMLLRRNEKRIESKLSIVREGVTDGSARWSLREHGPVVSQQSGSPEKPFECARCGGSLFRVSELTGAQVCPGCFPTDDRD